MSWRALQVGAPPSSLLTSSSSLSASSPNETALTATATATASATVAVVKSNSNIVIQQNEAQLYSLQSTYHEALLLLVNPTEESPRAAFNILYDVRLRILDHLQQLPSSGATSRSTNGREWKELLFLTQKNLIQASMASIQEEDSSKIYEMALDNHLLMEELEKTDISVVCSTAELALANHDHWTYNNILAQYENKFSSLYQRYLDTSREVRRSLPLCKAKIRPVHVQNIDHNVINAPLNLNHIEINDLCQATTLFGAILSALSSVLLTTRKSPPEASELLGAVVGALSSLSLRNTALSSGFIDTTDIGDGYFSVDIADTRAPEVEEPKVTELSTQLKASSEQESGPQEDSEQQTRRSARQDQRRRAAGGNKNDTEDEADGTDDALRTIQVTIKPILKS